MTNFIYMVLGRTPSTHSGAQLVRYGVVAACGYFLAIALYTVQIEVGVSPYLALGVAFVLNGVFNFTLVRVWAFPSSGRSVNSDFGRFCVVAAVSFVVNYASFAVLYSAVGLYATTAQRLAILIAAPITFLANKLWSFRVHPSGRDAQVEGDLVTTSAKNESYSRI